MAFDIDGARKSGYSNTEIADYMASQGNFDSVAARKSGYSDDDIIAHLAGPAEDDDDRNLAGDVGKTLLERSAMAPADLVVGVADLAGRGARGVARGIDAVAGTELAESVVPIKEQDWYKDSYGRGRKEIADLREEQLSPETVQQQQNVSQSIKDASGGLLSQIGAGMKASILNPRALAITLAESAPDMLVGMGVARGAAKAALTNNLSKTAAAARATTAAAGTEATQAANYAADAAGSYIDGLSDQALAQQSPEYIELTKSIGPDAARRKIRANAMDIAAVISGVATMGGAKVTGAAGQLGRVASRDMGLPGGSAGNWMTRLLKGGAKEGGEELLQEGGDAYAQNEAAISSGADPTRSRMEGVGAQAGAGAVAGGLMGAPLGVLDSNASPELPPGIQQIAGQFIAPDGTRLGKTPEDVRAAWDAASAEDRANWMAPAPTDDTQDAAPTEAAAEEDAASVDAAESDAPSGAYEVNDVTPEQVNISSNTSELIDYYGDIDSTPDAELMVTSEKYRELRGQHDEQTVKGMFNSDLGPAIAARKDPQVAEINSLISKTQNPTVKKALQARLSARKKQLAKHSEADEFRRIADQTQDSELRAELLAKAEKLSPTQAPAGIEVGEPAVENVAIEAAQPPQADRKDVKPPPLAPVQVVPVDNSEQISAPLPQNPINGNGSKPTVETPVDQAAHEAATSPTNDRPEPTQAQKESESYKMGHPPPAEIGGLNMSIENPEGSTRSGEDAKGKPWSVTMKHHYGRFKGTVGMDGEHVDSFIKPGATDFEQVFVIDQINQDGTPDEHKVMLGFGSQQEAEQAYLDNYEEGWTGLGAITPMPLPKLKEWLKTSDTKKPIAYKESSNGIQSAGLQGDADQGAEGQSGDSGGIPEPRAGTGQSQPAGGERRAADAGTPNATTRTPAPMGEQPSQPAEALDPDSAKAEARLKRSEFAKKQIEEYRKPDQSKDDLVFFLRKHGGINAELESDIRGRLGHLNKGYGDQRIRPGIPGIEQKGGRGMSMDDAAELAYEAGYIESQDTNLLLEKLMDAELDPIYSKNRSESEISKEVEAEMRAAYGEDVDPLDPSGWDDAFGKPMDVSPMARETAELISLIEETDPYAVESIPPNYSDEQFLEALKEIISGRKGKEADRSKQEPDSGGQADSGSETRGSGQERATQQDAGFQLEEQTEESRLAAERKQDEAKALEKADRKAAEDRAKAEADRDNFSLTGSDRAADVAMAGGQKDLLSSGDESSTLSSDLAIGLPHQAEFKLGGKVYRITVDRFWKIPKASLPADKQDEYDTNLSWTAESRSDVDGNEFSAVSGDSVPVSMAKKAHALLESVTQANSKDDLLGDSAEQPDNEAGPMPAPEAKEPDPDEFPTKEVGDSYAHISHSAGSRGRMEKEWFDKAMADMREQHAPQAITDEQKALLEERLKEFRRTYISKARGLAGVRSGVVSGHIAGGSNFNTGQAQRRGNALDRATAEFDGWQKGYASKIEAALLAARTPEQRDADNKKTADKAYAKLRAKVLADVLTVREIDTGKMPGFDRSSYIAGITRKLVAMSDEDARRILTEIRDSQGDWEKPALGKRHGIWKKMGVEFDAPAKAKKTEPAKDTEAKKPAEPQGALEMISDVVTRLRQGTASVDEYQQAFAKTTEGETELRADLTKKTKDVLLDMLGPMAAYRVKGEKKDKIVNAVYEGIVGDFALGNEYRESSYFLNEIDKVRAREAAKLKAIVEAQTPETLAAYAAEFIKAAAERKAVTQKRIEAAKNPETLDQFRDYFRLQNTEGKTEEETRLAMTPELRVKYDALLAEQSRAGRKSNEASRRANVSTSDQKVGGEIIATKHTRDGYDLFVVKLDERVGKDDYRTLLGEARRLGGWYSRYRGNGAIPGFQFKSKDSAEAFMNLAAGDTAQARQVAAERRSVFEDDRSQTAAERLRAMSARLDERAAESLGRERRANTQRQAGMAANAEANAQADKAFADTMSKIADAIDSGDAKFLDLVREKKQLELLDSAVKIAKGDELRAKHESYSEQEKHKGEPPTAETADFAKYPKYWAYRSDLAVIARKMLEVDGLKLLGKQLASVADDITTAYEEFAKENLHKVSAFTLKDGGMPIFTTKAKAEYALRKNGLLGKAFILQIKRGQHMPVMSPSEAIGKDIWSGDGDKRITLKDSFGQKMVEAIGKANRRASGISLPHWFDVVSDRQKTLARMGIETPAEYRSALREYISMRTAPPGKNKIKEMEREMIGRKNDGLDFFPTPSSQADAMIGAAEIAEGMTVLEPSAGMGHIAEQIREAGVDPDVIEFDSKRRELLELKGFNVLDTNDFLEWKAGSRDSFNAHERELSDELKDLKDSESRLERLSEKAIRDGVGLSRARATTREANSGRAAADRDTRKSMLKNRLRGLAADGVEIPQKFLDAIGSSFEYDASGKYAPIESSAKGVDSRGYDRIIMNPPFSNGRDIDHVKHAFDLLNPGGRLVAIMGEGAFFNSSKKATAFREWLDEVSGSSEKLSEGTFKDPSLPVTTGVNARMVVIDKPGSAQSGTEPEYRMIAGEPAKGISVEKVQAVVDRFVAASGPGLRDLRFEVRADKHAAFGDKAPSGTVKGAYYGADGRVLLIAAGLDSAEDAEKTLLHEVVGHYGLNTFAPEVKRAILDLILETRSNESFKDIWRSIDKDYATKSEHVRAEEVFAAMAEQSGGKIRAAFDKLMSYIAGVLRKHRVIKGLWRPAELRNLANEIAKGIKSGKAKQRTWPSGNGSQFSNQPPAPTYYSKLLQVAREKLPNKGGAKVFKAMFEAWGKKGQFKSEELEWSGLMDWLDNQGKELNKSQVLDFLDQGGVQVEEVMLGDPEGLISEQFKERGYSVEYDELDEQIMYIDPDGESVEYHELPDDLQRVVDEASKKPSGKGPAKYGKYQLPGGKNYRELLLTLPHKPYEQLEPEVRALGITKPLDDVSYGDLENAGATASLLDSWHRALKSTDERRYMTSHWNEPNVLAHIRFNDRTDADGNKVLLIEELQSDWHQEGRKQGYSIGKDKANAEINKALGAGSLADLPQVEQQRLIALAKTAETGVPNAPFKKTWPDLALKRVIRYAAENGYDKVAWVGGEQQAERYDLSKQVDEILYSLEDDGTYRVVAMKDGRAALQKDSVPPAGLSDLVGKEVAERVIAGEGDAKKSGGYMGNDHKSLSGGNLKIGGEGMKAFYDFEIPTRLKKLTKQAVGKTQIEIPGATKIGNFAKELPARPERVVEYEPGWFALGFNESDATIGPNETWGRFKTKSLAESVLEKAQAQYDGSGGSLQSIDITDQLAERALGEGFALFKRAYHGGPHRFSKFSLDAMGTGEGRHAYGWGLYFADRREIAEWYRDTVSYGDIVRQFRDELPDDADIDEVQDLAHDKEFSPSLNELVLALAEDDWLGFDYPSQAITAALQELEAFDSSPRLKKAVENSMGSLYQVDIPEDDVLLDWDAPLNEQSEQVIKSLRRLNDPYINKAISTEPESVDDGDYWRYMGDTYGTRSEALDDNTPAEIMQGRRGTIGKSPEAVAHALNQVGIKGLRYRDNQSRKFRNNPDATRNYVIWDEDSVTVEAINDELVQAEEQESGEPLLSVKSDTVDQATTPPRHELDANQLSALSKIGVKPKKLTAADIKEKLQDSKLKLAQGIVDQFAPLKELDEVAYMQARLSKGTDGGLEAVLLHGTPVLKDGALSIDRDGRGFLGAMSEILKGEHDTFLAWVAGNRAEKLLEEGRENLFTEDDIKALKTLNRGKLPDGTPRALAYAKALKELQRYQKSFLDVAEQSGLIDPDGRDLWESEFYLPFYRALREGNSTFHPGSRGLVRQEAFKRLKGGVEPLNDLLENTIANWSHLLAASMRNQAATKALAAAEKVGIAERIGQPEKGSLWVSEAGQQVHYRVDDQLVLDALMALDYQGIQGMAMDTMRAAKRALTIGVTASPTFRVRNLIRDTISALGVDDNTGHNPVKNIIQGWKATSLDGDTNVDLLAGGGKIRFGSFHDGDAKHAKRLIEMGVKDADILDAPNKVKNFFKGAIDWYQETGDKAETVNRAVIYENAIKAGKNHLEASFLARDLMDFSMTGKWTAVRFLTQTVPFMNARAQGFYKLGRAAKSNPMRFGAVTGVVALASALLYALQADDDDYKGLPDWVRDTYWPVKIGSKFVYIPKPFEIGALGSIVERGTELAMAGDDYQAKDFRGTVAHILLNELSMNPIPQAIKPLVEVGFNYDMFRKWNIDSPWDKTSPRHHYRPSTSAGARIAGDLLNESPNKIEHLVRGYFGWLGVQALNASDWLGRGMAGYSSNPRRDMTTVDNWFSVGDFVKTAGAGSSKYVERFYDMQKDVNRAIADAKETGDSSDPKLKLKARYTSKAQGAPYRQISDLNKKIKAVANDTDLSPSDKRREIDALVRRRNSVAKNADQRTRAMTSK